MLQVIRLCKSIVSGNDMDTDEDNGTVYSLSLVDTESVHTAHEKDMAQFRDMLAEEDSPQATATTMALDPTLHQHSIYNEEFQTARLTAHASQEERLSGRVVAAPPPAASTMMPSSRMPTKSARKATTAASFFAAKVPAKSKDSSKQSSKPKDTAKKSPKEKKSKTTNDNKKPKATKEVEDEPEEMDIDASDGVVQEEKENSCNKKVGNADDFVGDEDEDDDFIQEEEDRKRRNAAREKKQRAKKKTQKEVPEQEEEDDEPVKVHGAMDAFTQHQEKKPSTHKNKRRKRLVEKTTMDASGYIHTETQAVWEDVEDDEEEPEPVKMAPIKKAPVKNTKNMKQGNLMGFFKKK